MRLAVHPLVTLITLGVLVVHTMSSPVPLAAQHAHPPGSDSSDVARPDHVHGTDSGTADEASELGYPALLGREIKALSPERVRQLLTAEGMGLALAAELNGVPGPRHVLELAAELGLTAEQESAVRSVEARMREAALALGEGIIAAEREMDRAFAEGRVSAREVAARAEEIGRLEGRLRAAHLVAHLETAAILEPAQRERYAELRGYAPR